MLGKTRLFPQLIESGECLFKLPLKAAESSIAGGFFNSAQADYQIERPRAG